jgi:hypothetical protein
LSACEIERIHIFEEGSSLAKIARGGNTMRRDVTFPVYRQTFCYLALFLVMNGRLFRIHWERDFTAEGRTELVENGDAPL